MTNKKDKTNRWFIYLSIVHSDWQWFSSASGRRLSHSASWNTFSIKILGVEPGIFNLEPEFLTPKFWGLNLEF